MHFFEVDHNGEIRYGIPGGQIELGQGGDGYHYRIEADGKNPPTKNGDQFVQGTYRKETLGNQVILFLQGEIAEQNDAALVVFRNESYKATCFVKSGTLDQVLAVEDDGDGFKSMVMEMAHGDSLEIKNGQPAFTISYDLNLAPLIERQTKVFS